MFRTAFVSSVLLAATAALSTPALADDPAPSAAVKNLSCMVGTWRGNGTLTMGKDKVPLKLVMKCEATAGGFGVTCDDVITGIPGMDAYRERDLWGINAADGSVHWFAITNGGEAHDHHGKIGKDSFDGQYSGRRNGKRFVEKISLKFAGEDRFHGTSQAYENGVAAEGLQFEMVKDDGRRAGR